MSSTPSTPRTFTRLGQDVHVSYAQATSALPVSKDSPSLIIIFGWMDAQLPHVLKYAQGHDALFLGATILIVRSRGAFLFSTQASRLKSIAPALKVIQEHVDLGTLSPPRILIHAFSNGGCFQLATVLTALSSSRLSSSMPKNPATTPALPAQLLVFDSSPGTGSLTNFTRAFSALIKSPFLRFFFRVFLTVFYFAWYTLLTFQSLFHILLYRRRAIGLFDGMLDALLSPAFLPKSAPRVLIYSKSDKLVDWKDVENFAGRCEGKGIRVIKTRYEKTGHVNHLKGEGEGGKDRYWSTIKDAWEVGITQCK